MDMLFCRVVIFSCCEPSSNADSFVRTKINVNQLFYERGKCDYALCEHAVEAYEKYHYCLKSKGVLVFAYALV
jgi:hypothetical protein